MRSARTALEPELRLGCAGWSLPRAQWPQFEADGSHLERYAKRFSAVEVNSSFYRPHRRETYARWAGSTSAGFRFSVKVPKQITHDAKLVRAMPLFAEFLSQVGGLGDKLGCLLIQLPPSLALDPAQTQRFLVGLRQRHDGAVALEPRHPSWFEHPADALLDRYAIGRVLADPVLHGADAPGGWAGLAYLRLHGSPRRYWSSYTDELLQRLAARLLQAQRAGTPCWCIFDNTAGGEAIANALTLDRLVNANAAR